VTTNIAIVNALPPATTLPCERGFWNACLAEKGIELMRNLLTIVVAAGLLSSAAGCYTVGICDCDYYPYHQAYAGPVAVPVAVPEPLLKPPAPTTQLPKALPAAPAAIGQ
jgi:hypothetical protein